MTTITGLGHMAEAKGGRTGPPEVLPREAMEGGTASISVEGEMTEVKAQNR